MKIGSKSPLEKNLNEDLEPVEASKSMQAFNVLFDPVKKARERVK